MSPVLNTRQETGTQRTLTDAFNAAPLSQALGCRALGLADRRTGV